MINNQSEQREKINFYIPVTHLETSLHQKNCSYLLKIQFVISHHQKFLLIVT